MMSRSLALSLTILVFVPKALHGQMEGLSELFRSDPSHRVQLSVDGDDRDQNPGQVESAFIRSLRTSHPVTFADSRMRISAVGEWLSLDQDLNLPGASGQAKMNLYQLGVQGTWYSDQGPPVGESMWMVSGGLSSPSDQPFYSLNEVAVTTTVGWMPEKRRDGGWLWAVNYSNNRSFLNNIPLPGFMYFHQPSRTFQLSAGLPFAGLRWLPVDRLSFVTFIGPYRALVDTAWLLNQDMQVFAKFNWSQSSYFHIARDDRLKRIFFDEKRASLGLRAPIGRTWGWQVGWSYVFDRKIFEGLSVSRKTSDTLSLQDRGFLDAQVGLNATF